MSQSIRSNTRLQRLERYTMAVLLWCRAKEIPLVSRRWVRRARDTPSCQCLGGGGYGDAFLVGHPDVPSKRLVVKDFRGHQEEMVRELGALLLVQDVPGVQRLAGVCLDTKEIITEYAGKTLHREVLLRDLSMKDKLWVTYRTLFTVDRLHKKGLCHNDLKLDNICIDHTPSGLYKVTLIDFGLVRTTWSVVLQREVHHPNEYFPWMSPEVAARGPCSPASDVFSLGVLIFMVFDQSSIPYKVRRWATQAMNQQAKERPSLQNGMNVIKNLLSKALRRGDGHQGKFPLKRECEPPSEGALPTRGAGGCEVGDIARRRCS